MKIYTKTGDGGETSLLGGQRVAKSDARVAAYGEVDELGAWLGVIRAEGVAETLGAMLQRIQRELFALGSRLADPTRRIGERVAKTSVTIDDVARLEGWIDELESGLPPLEAFVLAGGTPAGARLHLARTVCRRAERRIVELGPGAVEPELLAYVNRLSDLLFVMARAANARAGAAEEKW